MSPFRLASFAIEERRRLVAADNIADTVASTVVVAAVVVAAVVVVAALLHRTLAEPPLRRKLAPFAGRHRIRSPVPPQLVVRTPCRIVVAAVERRTFSGRSGRTFGSPSQSLRSLIVRTLLRSPRYQ